MADERGSSTSTFFAVIFPALLLIAGLVIDGSAHSAAHRSAEVAAAEAARAGSDAAAAKYILADKSNTAVSAAHAAISRHAGVSGQVDIDSSGRLHVHTSTTVHTTFLSLIGITTLTAHGKATAELHR